MKSRPQIFNEDQDDDDQFKETYFKEDENMQMNVAAITNSISLKLLKL